MLKTRLQAILLLLIPMAAHAQVSQDTPCTNCAWGNPDYTWAADFNHDGLTDIASAHKGNIYVYKSTAKGFVFQTWDDDAEWGSAAYTWTADFNGDGKIDIASAKGTNINVYLSTGTAFKGYTWPLTGNVVWGGSDYTWVGDFNGDGKADIASAKDSNIYVYTSTGSGFTESKKAWSTSASFGNSSYSWVGDFNSDGYADIASANADKLYLHWSAESGTRFTSTTLTVGKEWGASGNTWARAFVGKGQSNILSIVKDEKYVQTGVGIVPSKFVPAVRYLAYDTTNHKIIDKTVQITGKPGSWWASDYVWAADFTGNGIAEIVQAYRNHINMFESKVAKITGSQFEIAGTWGRREWTWVGDFDGDGKADIASANGGAIYMRLSTGSGFKYEVWNPINSDSIEKLSRVELSSKYTMPLQVGKPPKTYQVLVDTGSSNLLLLGDSKICGNCKTVPGKTYSPSLSSTSLNQIKTFHLSYGSGNDKATAMEYIDVVSLPGGRRVSNTFGAITHDKRIENILGLGYLSGAAPDDAPIKPWFDELVEQTGIENQFAMFHCSKDKSGYIEFGGYSVSFTRFMNVTPGEDGYVVTPQTLDFNGITLGNFSGHKTYVDSGTESLWLSPEMQKKLLEELTRVLETLSSDPKPTLNTTTDDPHPTTTIINLTPTDLLSLPTLQVVDGDNKYNIPPSAYLSKNSEENSYQLLAYPDTNGDGLLLGQVFMNNFYTVFDRESTPNRVGFASLDLLCH